MSSRRKFLLAAATAGTTAIAGCAGLGGANTLSWEDAFQQHLTDNDASLLEPTPVVVDEVTSETEVKTSLAVLGWTKSGRDVSTEAVDRMDGFATTAADLREAISPVLTRLNDVVDLINSMKETSVLGASVWDALVTAKPPLAGFDDVARELQGLLEGISGRLGDIETAAGDVSARVREIRSQRTTEYADVPQAVGAMNDVTAGLVTDLQEVIDRITDVEELASEATAAADGLPGMSREVSSVFGALNAEVATVRRQFEGVQSDIEYLRGVAGDLRGNAAALANQRYEPISSDATGSAEQMSVGDVNTGVEAYRSE